MECYLLTFLKRDFVGAKNFSEELSPKGRSTMPKFNFFHPGARFALLALVTVSALLLTSGAMAQTTVAQGSIQGTVTDPSGAVVSGAKITITNKATGQVATTTSSSSGTYNSGGLIPGDYVVRVEARRPQIRSSSRSPVTLRPRTLETSKSRRPKSTRQRKARRLCGG